MQGGDYGRVLIGLEFPEGDVPGLEIRLAELGYRYQEETGNPAYSLFCFSDKMIPASLKTNA